MRPSKYNEDTLKQAQHYLENYQEQNHPFPSIIGLSRVLNVSHSALKRWRNDKDKTELKTTLEMIKDEQHLQLIHKGLSGDFHASITKLMLFNFGYSEKKEINGHTEPVIVSLMTHFEPNYSNMTDLELVDYVRNKKPKADLDYSQSSK